VATNMPIVRAGAKIRWADVDPVTGMVTTETLARACKKNTKAVMAVSWGGATPLLDTSKLPDVIYDAAHVCEPHHYLQSIPGRQPNERFRCLSFQAIKILTSVDGGMLLCRDARDAAEARLMRWYGIDRTEPGRTDFRCEKDIRLAGTKAHMNDVAAAIGLANAQYLDFLAAAQFANCRYYDERFKGSPIRSAQPNCGDGQETHSARWLYTIHVPDREKFMARMREAGIVVSQVHARNDKHSVFKDFLPDDFPRFDDFDRELPGVFKFYKSMVCIPVGWWLSHEQREYVADKALKAVE